MLAGSVDYIPYNIQNTNSKGEVVIKKHYVPNHQDYPPLIPDDNILYITEANTKIVIIDDEKDNKLEIIIRKING